ncbi:hypothetical protein FPZ42_07675 [Mucilaginibacter achroorhodeus]|uniref:Uncharacterized protein n=1 Tax=Mucilaginibacter achroorhodeus TaxID=2599294 RepID=A0A563U6E0_9SPHI|nr:hypothetical protein [Mucilaginibacter achroorhodeus]TWR26905.1 hypothetical protein FPZ42_07675 [Mucilaginibacter achroorhodeus]
MKNLNYQIFLLDDVDNYAELDCEDLDLITTFSITDIADISSRKDNLSKNLTFKGTKTNNKIFGNVFNQSRFVDPEIVGNLFVNFSVNKQVECQVFENSTLILKGFLEFQKATMKGGEIVYECIITGNIFNFYSLLGDKYLSDLDFSEYKHEYRVNNITNSWYNMNAINGVNTLSATGSGYVYPFINYGEGNSPKAEDINKIHINNFRPSIYVKTYLDKMFAQDDLAGFTYELKGSNDFKTAFNQLIVPDNREFLSQSVRGVQLFSMNLNGTQTFSYNDGDTHYQGGARLINIIKFPDGLTSINNNTLTPSQWMYDGNYNTLFTLNRTLISDISIHFNSIYFANNSGRQLKAYLRAYIRSKRNHDTDYGNWVDLGNYNLLGEVLVGDLSNGTSTTRNDITLNVAQTTLAGDSDFYISVDLLQPDNQRFDKKYTLTLNGGTVRTPGVTASTVSYSVLKGDTIKPEAVSNLKQKDFIKSLSLMFNLFSYSDLFNPRHIIFETYNDYYSKTLPQNIISATNSIDVTLKIDYNKDFVMSAFDKVANKYTFKYKSDTDFYNTLYTNTYKEIYGEFTETYTEGTAEAKTVELSFSPTPIVNIANTGRLAAEIYTSDDSGHKPMKSNPRILFYNGVKICSDYQIGTMIQSGNDWNFTPIIEIPTTGIYSSYGQASHLRYANGSTDVSNILSDLNFGITGQYYFPVSDRIYITPNLFTNHYDRQLQEITDTNNVIINCDVLFNESNISNLDLKTPIFIHNQYGNAYYKILELEYTNRFETSSLKAQKINITPYFPVVAGTASSVGTGSNIPPRPPMIMI